MAKRNWKKAISMLVSAAMTVSMCSVGSGGFLIGRVFAGDDDLTDAHNHNPISCSVCQGTGKKMEECDSCGGTGSIQGEPVDCSKCEGGKIWGFGPACEVCGKDGVMDDGSTCKTCGGGGALWVEQDCPTCNGEGKIAQVSNCTACAGTGWVKTDEDCPECGGDGSRECTGTFEESGLSGVDYNSEKQIAGGKVEYRCERCGAAYEEVLDADAVQAILAQEVSLDTFTVSSATASAGQKLTYTLKVRNNSSFNIPEIRIQIQLSDDLVFTEYSSKQTVHYSGPYKGSPAPIYSKPTDSYDSDSHLLILTVPGIVAGKYLDATFYATVDNDAVTGIDLPVELSATVSNQPADHMAGYVSSHINRYTGTKNIYLAGARMAGWYNPGNDGSIGTATTFIGNRNTSLDALLGQKFSFDGAFNKDASATTGYVRYDTTDADYYGQILENPHDLRT